MDIVKSKIFSRRKILCIFLTSIRCVKNSENFACLQNFRKSLIFECINTVKIVDFDTKKHVVFCKFHVCKLCFRGFKNLSKSSKICEKS